MAAPYYQNQHTYSVIVPTASGVDVLLDTGQVVQGDPYSIFAYDDTLVLVAGPYTYPTLRYSWPGSGGSGGSGTITDINCITPITGGGISGTIDIGLASLGVTGDYIANGTITANKLASGAAVSGLLVGTDTLKDIVELVAGTNVVLTTNLTDNSIIVSTNSNVVTAVDATLPLSVQTTNGTATISLDVTTTNNGGAVALQPTDLEPLVQTGITYVQKSYTSDFISVNVPYDTIIAPDTVPSAIYLQALTTGDYALSAFTSAGVLNTYLTNGGTLYTTAIKNKGTVEVTTFSLIEDIWTGTNPAKGYLTTVTANYNNNFLNIPFKFFNTLTLSQDGTGTGKIVGIPSIESLLQFSTGTYPAIKLGTTSATAADLALAVHDNGGVTPTIGLYTDGTITCKRVVAKYETHTNVYLPAGNYTVSSYPGISTFVCDSVSGVSSFTLPELDANSVNGQTYTFKKYDISSNAIVIVPAVGQTIDNTFTQFNLTTQGSFVRLQAVIVTGGTPKYFWITC